MILVATRAWICCCASRLVPSAMASIEITAATPKTMPSTVRPDRSLCSKRLFIPNFRPRQMRPMAPSSRVAPDPLGRAGGVRPPSARRPDGGGRPPLALTILMRQAWIRRPERGLSRRRPFGLPRGGRPVQVGGADQRRLRGLHPRAGAVVDDEAVPHPDDPLGVLGDVVLVGDHDDGLPRVIELAEHLHDLVAGLGVEVPRRL